MLKKIKQIIKNLLITYFSMGLIFAVYVMFTEFQMRNQYGGSEPLYHSFWGDVLFFIMAIIFWSLFIIGKMFFN